MNLDYIAKIGIEALKEAYKKQRELLEKGRLQEIISKGSGVDMASMADVESEKAVIDFLKKEEFPARIHSEEHGDIDLVKKPKYLLTLDGLDGSSGMVKDPKNRCGTMLGIAKNLDPKYNDFIFGGITEYITERILFGAKNKGVWLLKDPNEKNERTIRINKIARKGFDENSRIHLDDFEFYDYQKGITSQLSELDAIVKDKFSGKLKHRCKPSGLSSSAAMAVDLILGNVDAVCGILAKGVFEPPAEYPLIKEIGGIMCGLNGKDTGNEKYYVYGRPQSPLLIAANKEIAKSVLNVING